MFNYPHADEGQKMEREKIMKTQVKQIKQRMARLALDYLDPQPMRDSPHKLKLNKFFQDIKTHQHAKDFDSIDEILGKILRLLHSNSPHHEANQDVIRQVGGLDTIVNLCFDSIIPSK